MKKQFYLLLIISFYTINVFAFDGVILPYKEVSITTKISSFINSIKVHEGEFIKKGAVICELDDKKIKQELEEGEIEIAKLYFENKKLKKGTLPKEIKKLEISFLINKNKYNELVEDFDALKKIFETDGISKKELEKKKNEVEVSKLNLDKSELDVKIAKETPQQIDVDISLQNIAMKEFNIKQTKEKLNHIIIKSELSAFVKEIKVNEGDYISEGNKILTMVDISKVYAESNISINKISNFKIGGIVSVFLPMLNKKIEGTVSAIFPEIDSATNTVKVRILIDNKNYKIKPGMLVSVK